LAQSAQRATARKTAAASSAEKAAATASSDVAHPLVRADLEAFFDGIIPLQLERSDIAGATVLVMKDGKDLLRKGYGFSDITRKNRLIRKRACFGWRPSPTVHLDFRHAAGGAREAGH